MHATPELTMPLRVLYLTHHLPYPPRSGGRRREYELLKRIGDQAQIHLLAVSKTYEEDRQNAANMLEFCSAVDLFAADGRARDDDPAQVARHRCHAARRRTAELLSRGTFDLVHVEGFYLWQLLSGVPPSSRPPTVLVSHNVEHALWLQRAEVALDDERAKLLSEAARTRAAEIAAWREADACVAITEADRAKIAEVAGCEVALVPDGFDHLSPTGPRAHPEADATGRVVMVGNFGYEPNVDAALWLTDEIAPRLREEQPDAELLLVGASPPPELIEAARSAEVSLEADVESVAPYLDGAQVVVCPLRVGGGVKVKMLEALARGKAIVTTHVGIQGLESAADSAVLVRESADEFAAAVAELLRRPERRRELARSALRFANTELPRWDDCADALLEAYAEISRVAAGQRAATITP